MLTEVLTKKLQIHFVKEQKKYLVVEETCCMCMELAGMEYVKTLVMMHPSMVEKVVVERTGTEVVQHMKKNQHVDKECLVEVG